MAPPKTSGQVAAASRKTGMQKFYTKSSSRNNKSTTNMITDPKTSVKVIVNSKLLKRSPKSTINVQVQSSDCSNTQVNVIHNRNSNCQTRFENHVYENVENSNITVTPQKTNEIKKITGEIKDDISTNKNVTILQINDLETSIYEDFEFKTDSNAKLQFALDNFDKIFNEYKTHTQSVNHNLPGSNSTPVTPASIPKFQKSKTCSIIESRCILKKTASDPTSSKSASTNPEGLQSRMCQSLQDTFNDKCIQEARNFWHSKTNNSADKIPDAKNRYDTYKVPIKKPIVDVSRVKVTPKLDVKTRLIRKTFSTPAPVPRTRNLPDKPQTSVPNAVKKVTRNSPVIPIQNTPKTSHDNRSSVKARSNLPRAKSVWEVSPSGVELEKGKSRSVSCIIKSASKIPVKRTVKSSMENLAQEKQNVSTVDRSMSEKERSKFKTKELDVVDQCLERGHRILKKVEALGVQRGVNLQKEYKNTINKQQGGKIKNPIQAYVEKFEKRINQENLKKTAPSKTVINMELRKGEQCFLEPIPFESCKLLAPQIGGSQHKAVSVVVKPCMSFLEKQIMSVNVRKDELFCVTSNTVTSNERFNNDIPKLSRKISKKIHTFDKLLNEVQKEKEYTSDCSDDSGHISNENEPIEVLKPKRISNDILCKFEKRKTSIDHGFQDIDEINNKNKKLYVSSCTKVIKAAASSKDDGNKTVNEKKEVLFRAGVLSHLEGRRDEQVSGRVVQLQAACRGYLARKRVTRRRVEVVAVRCLQRNVRAFLSVRDWPWWRLLVRVTPLLNVHRTEEELKAKTEELEVLRTKVDKLETERFSLKHDNDRLESKLSEMTADLAEEHSTAMMASERLDAETAERVRLERDLLETQIKNKSLQQTSERLEMELLYARSDLNGVHSDSEDANSEHGDSGGVYKQRYERVSRELEFTRRRLQQQHEDDLEQLVGLKKQLEKKLADAYEEVEEQRQVVGQWKRKVQKLNGEMNDLRLLLEEQNSRNNILEKKQRKFDSETQMMHDDIRQEKQAKERIGREKDVLIAEKFTLEQNLADTRLELELKDERLINLQQELDEFTFGGKTEEEVAQLKKIKHELDNKCRDQEEELDDLAGQVQILEQAKLRLEMSLENLRKESRREAQQRDDEIEEVRGNAQKKVKALESQLESEHEERTLLLREKHELERRLTSAEEALRSDHQVDVEVVQRLKRDLKRTKALLRDAQTMLERNKADSPGKAVMRQLRNQLEDSECARLTAVKAKQTLEGEVAELQASLDEGNRLRSDAEDRASQAHRERGELRGQLEENEEELAEVLKKYRSTVQQLSLEQLSVTEQATRVSELESEKSALKETVAELSARLEAMETLGDPNTSLQQIRLESRIKELESKLDLEQTTRSRLEVQMSRHKEALERSTSEATASRSKEQVAQDSVRKLQRNLRELRDEFHTLAARETECIQRRKELEKRLEVSEAENSSTRADLRLALQRIEDLQTAMQGEISGSENSDSEHDSYSSDESIDTFLANHKVSPNKSAQPTSSSHDASPRISVKKENSVSISSDQDPNTSFA